MAGRRRVLHVIRDAQKTLCACYWYPGDRVATFDEAMELRHSGRRIDFCKTCTKRLLSLDKSRQAMVNAIEARRVGATTQDVTDPTKGDK